MNIPNGNRKRRSRVDCSAPGAAMSDFELTSAVRSDACLLLTGKSDAARAVAYRIHRLSGWGHGPFTIVDCAGAEELVESALSGVFDEAESSAPREPHPRLAQAGTILLENVGRLGATLQFRLAERLLDLRGKRLPGRCRWRLMASSAEPLMPRVLDGTFDDRLFYRLNVIHVVIPGGKTTADCRGVSGVGGSKSVKHWAAHDSPSSTRPADPHSPGTDG